MKIINAITGGTFCGHQFMRLLFAAVSVTFIMNFNFIADKILASQFLGNNAMAGIEIVMPLLYVTAFLELMIATGTVYIYSYEIGAFNDERANCLIGQGFMGTFLLSFFLAVSLYVCEDLYLSLFGNAETTIDFARLYYEPFLATIVIHPVYILMQMTVYADGGGRYCVFATATQIIIHITAAFFFTSILDMGMTGIALGVFIGEIVAMAIFARWIFFVSRTIKPIFRFSFSDAIKVLKLSYVNAALSLYIAVGNLILVIYFLQTFEQEYFPIMSAAISIFQLAIFLSGVEKATEPIVNVYLGENNFNGVIKVMKVATLTALILGVLTIPFMWIFCRSIADLFSIADPTLVAESEFVIRIVALAMPFISLLYLFTMYYQISGYFKIAMSLSACKDLLLYVGIPIFFSLFLDMRGIWFGMTAVPIVTFLLFAVILRIRYPKTFPLLAPAMDIVSRDEKLDSNRAIELRDWAESEFQKRGFSSRYVMKTGLIVEEICMSIVDKNPGVNVLAELTLFFEGEPKIILRDNGKFFDMTQDNLGSFRDFFIYSVLMKGNTQNRFLETQNYNRHVFSLLPEKLEEVDEA